VCSKEITVLTFKITLCIKMTKENQTISYKHFNSNNGSFVKYSTKVVVITSFTCCINRILQSHEIEESNMVPSMVKVFYSMFSHLDTKELLLTDSNNQTTSCMLCKFVYVTV